MSRMQPYRLSTVGNKSPAHLFGGEAAVADGDDGHSLEWSDIVARQFFKDLTRAFHILQQHECCKHFFTAKKHVTSTHGFCLRIVDLSLIHISEPTRLG